MKEGEVHYHKYEDVAVSLIQGPTDYDQQRQAPGPFFALTIRLGSNDKGTQNTGKSLYIGPLYCFGHAVQWQCGQEGLGVQAMARCDAMWTGTQGTMGRRFFCEEVFLFVLARIDHADDGCSLSI